MFSRFRLNQDLETPSPAISRFRRRSPGKTHESLGHSEAQEIKILVLHGVLHLAGYDHENDNGVMAGKEAKLRKALGLPVGLIERNGLTLTRKRTEKAGKAIRKGMKRVENLSESSLEVPLAGAPALHW